MTTRNVVFIDSRVAGYRTLIAGFGADTAWHLLDANLDGIEQMQQVLSSHVSLDSVQIISHGSAGTLYLGSTVLDSDSLASYQSQFQAIGASLAEAGDILLYGCNLAADEAGKQFVAELALLTGADVSASDDTTGNPGNWVLEFSTGQVEAPAMDGSLTEFVGTLANTAPVLTASAPTLSAMSEDDKANAGQTVASLLGSSLSDADAGALRGIALHGVSGSYGKWQYSTNGGTNWSDVGTVSTASALLLRSSDWIRWAPDGSNGTTATLSYYGWDCSFGAAANKINTSTRGGTTAFSIDGDIATLTVFDVNDAPALANAIADQTATEDVGYSYQIPANTFSDLDNGITLTYSVTLNNGTPLPFWLSFDAATRTFSGTPTDAAVGDLDIRVTARDADALTTSNTFRLTVINVNDAPVLTPGTPTLTAITEDDTNNPGQTVASLLGNSLSDADAGAQQGIALYGISGSNGKWQYSTSGGTSWSDVGTVGTGSALLLSSSDWIRWSPDGNNGTTATLSYYGWDQSAGTAGSKSNVSVRGMRTAYSTTGDTATLAVASVPDAPRLIPIPDQTAIDDSPFSFSVPLTTLIEVDAGDGIAGYWAELANGDPLPMWLSFDAATRTFSGTPTDATVGYLDIRVTAYDADFLTTSDTFRLTVNDVNDAPVLTSGAPTLNAISEDDTNNPGQTVSSLLGNSLSDADTGALQGIALYGISGSHGKWQYNTDGGTNWSEVGSVGTASALLLSSSDWIRWTPDGSNGTTATLSYYGWDQSAGIAGSKSDVGVRGTSTAYSTAGDTATLPVVSINEGPAIGTADGKLTTSIGAENESGSLVIQADGKIVVAGSIWNGSNYDFALIRYNINGSLDASFNGTGKVTTPIGTGHETANSLAIQADGKIVVAGTSRNTSGNDDFALVRYKTDGSLDTSFNGTGKLITTIGSSNEIANSVVVQADGKIVLAGTSRNASGNDDFALVRYNSDGSLDTSLNGIGKVTTSINSSDEGANSVVVQADGKLLVAGYTYSSNQNFALLRYKYDGSLDTSFNGTGKVISAISTSSDTANSVAIQADGKIVVAGTSWNGGRADIALLRYNTNGSLDTSFSGDGKLTTAIGSSNDKAYSVAVQADGKIVVAGYSDNVSGNTDFALVRYNINGSLDTSFNGTGKIITAVGSSYDFASSLAIQADGKIVVAGSSSNGSKTDFALVRYNNNGSLDITFGFKNGLGGALLYSEQTPVIILEKKAAIFDVELSQAGNYSGASLTLTRHGGANAEDHFSAIGPLVSLTEGGSLTVSGTIIGTVIQNGAGTLALSFNSNATQELLNAAVRSIAYSISSDAPPASVQIDWVFNDGNTGIQGTGGAQFVTGSSVVNITAVNDAPTGDVTIIGSVTQGQTLTASHTLADLDGLGAISYQWNTDGAAINGATGSTFILTQAEVGKTISVTASYIDGQGTSEFVTSNATNVVTDINGTQPGIVTTDFGTTWDYGHSVTVQADGKILLAGVSQNGSQSDFALARYKLDGTLDTSFSGDGIVNTAIGTDWNAAYCVTVQADGKILVAGTSDNGSYADFALVRYNADGTLDTSFSGDGIVTTSVGTEWSFGQSVTVQADGKILVAGTGGNGGNTAFALARYTVDGTLDPTFSGDGKLITDIGTDGGSGESVTIQADGKILVAGTSDNGNFDNFALVRYNPDGTLDSTFSGDGIVTTSISTSSAEGFSVAVQADGKILVAGESDDGAGDNDFALVRYNSDGTLDTSFSGDGKLTTDIGTSYDFGYSVTLQANGKILVAGTSDLGSFALVRYNPDGTLDSSFSGDGIVTTTIGTNDAFGQSVTVQGDGKILVAGTSDYGSGADFALVRYNPDGTLDTRFGSETVNSSPTGAVTISGTASQGQRLTASHNLADFDGLGKISFQWNADGVAINGAVGSSYDLTQADVGKSITVTARYTDGYGTVESVTSDATPVVLEETAEVISNVSISALTPGLIEGTGAASTSFSFKVTLDQAPVVQQSLSWSVSGQGTNAAQAADFVGGVLPQGVLTFAAGETEKLIQIAVLGDDVPEFDEDFSVLLSAPSAGLELGGTSMAVATIISDDPPLSDLDGQVLTRKGQAMPDFEAELSLSTLPQLDLALMEETVATDGSRSLRFMLTADSATQAFGAFNLELVSGPGVAIKGLAPGTAFAGWQLFGQQPSAQSLVLGAFTSNPDPLSYPGGKVVLGMLEVELAAGHAGPVWIAVEELVLGTAAPTSGVLHYQTAADDGLGGFEFLALDDGQIDLDFTGNTAIIGRSITAQDALEALRLAVRIPSDYSDAYGLISADYNQDGRVTSQDALEILKTSVRMPDAIQPQWVFLSDEADLSALSSRNTGYKTGLSLSSFPVDASHNFTAVLLGDVNDSLTFV